MTTKRSKTVKIVNRRGLHARAAAKFVKLVEKTGLDIVVAKDGQEVPGLSIMGLLMLGAGIGTEVTITVKSSHSPDLFDEIAGLVERGFDEVD